MVQDDSNVNLAIEKLKLLEVMTNKTLRFLCKKARVLVKLQGENYRGWITSENIQVPVQTKSLRLLMYEVP